jgi:hypothetical protein
MTKRLKKDVAFPSAAGAEGPDRYQTKRTRKAKSSLRETPVQSLPPLAEEHPYDFAKRKAQEYELLLRNSKPGNALDPTAASAVDRPYDPFWDSQRLDVYNPFRRDPYDPFHDL